MHALRSGFVVFAAVAAAAAQMEKRSSGQFDAEAFAAAATAVGSSAPDLQLCDLEGRPRSLFALLGRTVVLVKGSYT
jgi:hypothetical protein